MRATKGEPNQESTLDRWAAGEAVTRRAKGRDRESAGHARPGVLAPAAHPLLDQAGIVGAGHSAADARAITRIAKEGRKYSNLVRKPVRDRDLRLNFHAIRDRGARVQPIGAGAALGLAVIIDRDAFDFTMRRRGSVFSIRPRRDGMRRARGCDPPRGSRRASTRRRTNPY